VGRFRVLLLAMLTAGGFLSFPLRLALPPTRAAVLRAGPYEHFSKLRKLSVPDRMRLRFEPNKGQFSRPVRFAARTKDYSLDLLPTELLLTPIRPMGETGHLRTGSTSRDSSKAVLVFAGSNRHPAITGVGKLQSVSNYFRGSDPRKWRSGIANYSSVEYQNIYRGVDLICHGEQTEPEFDWIVAPGADAEQIRLSVQGADPAIDPNGDLVLKLPSGEARLKKPDIFQEVNGTKHIVDGQFALRRENQIAFKIGDFDRTRPLVIDPVLVYSTYLGGSSDDETAQISVDGLGNIYVIGTAQSSDFPLVNPLQSNKPGFLEAFVTKFDASGSNLVYSTYLGGVAPGHVDRGNGIAVDASGNAYITGTTNDLNFPTTAGAYLPAPGGMGTGSEVGWTAEINPTGSSLIYSTYLTNNGESVPYAIAIDATGDAYLAGAAYPPMFPTTTGAYRSVDPGNVLAVFITKVNPSGSALVYSSLFGGNSSDQGFGIAVDSAGNAYVTGETSSSDFPVTTTLQWPSEPFQAFVTKLNASGTALVYSTLFGSAEGVGIAVDASGSAYITGYADDYHFPTAGPMQTQFQDDDAFVSKLDPSGTTLVYSIFLGGSDVDQGTGIALDSSGNAYVTGRTQSVDFPTVNAIQPVYSGGSLCAYNCSDAFVTVVSADGSKFLFSTYLGDTGFEFGFGITVDSAGSIYVTGITTSLDFPLAKPYQGVQNAIGENAGADSFVVKISGEASITPQRLVFGPAPLGSFQRQGLATVSAPQTLTFTNNASGSITFTTDTLIGTNPTEFAIASDSCAGSMVQPNGSCTIGVVFEPAAAGIRKANLQLSNSAENAPFIVSLLGYGSPVVFAPSILAFGAQSPGTTSAPQTLSITNSGSAPLTIGSLTPGGNDPQNFALQSDGCTGATLAANTSCSITIAFSAPATGQFSSTLSANDTASDSPQSVSITGIGTGPALFFSNYFLSFAPQTVGTTSPPQSVTVTNSGTAPLLITGITSTLSDFSQTNNCTSPVVAGGTCTIEVIFTPAAVGARSGSIQVSDNALGSPQQVELGGNGGAGTGSSGLLALPSQLSFGNQPVGTTSTSQMVNVTSLGTTAVEITGISVNSDFKQTNNCPVSESSTVNCEITVTFAPTAAGPRSGALTVTYAGAASPQTVSLAGQGNDFALVAAPTSSSVAPGTSAPYTVSVSPLGGAFNSPVTLGCSSLPQGASCNFSQTAVTPGTSTAQLGLSISTTAESMVSHYEPLYRAPPRLGLGLILLSSASFLALFCEKRFSRIVAASVILVGLCFLWSCGGGGGGSVSTQPSSGTPPGTYSITVTGTSGPLTHSQTVTLSVQ
jgi:Beta-propeller repeat